LLNRKPGVERRRAFVCETHNWELLQKSKLLWIRNKATGLNGNQQDELHLKGA